MLHHGNIYACLTDATNEQITITVYYFYDAPILPPGVFDDFRAITPTQGNATTMSYSDFILSLEANTTASRLVPTCPSAFLNNAPVAQYSPAVFDAFVNHSIVGPILQF
jgi:hypothetical protein